MYTNRKSSVSANTSTLLALRFNKNACGIELVNPNGRNLNDSERELLRELGFAWHRKLHYYYTRYSEEKWALISEVMIGTKENPASFPVSCNQKGLDKTLEEMNTLSAQKAKSAEASKTSNAKRTSSRVAMSEDKMMNMMRQMFQEMMMEMMQPNATKSEGERNSAKEDGAVKALNKVREAKEATKKEASGAKTVRRIHSNEKLTNAIDCAPCNASFDPDTDALSQSAFVRASNKALAKNREEAYLDGDTAYMNER